MRYRHRHFGPQHLDEQTLSQARATRGDSLKEIDRRPALIVIDMQNGFDEAAWGARPGTRGIEPKPQAILRADEMA
jgi:hypothetical protein